MHSNTFKTIHETFARFLESPTRESLRDFLKSHLGEMRNCDFKASWPEPSSVAKHILGLGNVGGGCLIVGVKENDDKTFSSDGLSEIKDKADILNGLKLYLPDRLFTELEIGDFPFNATEYGVLQGKVFQVVFVNSRADAVPYVSSRTGTGLRGSAIYIRREGSTEEATYEEIQRLIDQRLAASPQTAEARNLKDHLEELKVLYSEIPRTYRVGGLFGIGIDFEKIVAPLGGELHPNPDYPQEDYANFILRLLDGKKKVIQNLIGIPK